MKIKGSYKISKVEHIYGDSIKKIILWGCNLFE